MLYRCLQAGRRVLNMFQAEKIPKCNVKSPLWTSSPFQKMFWHASSSPSRQSSC